MLKAVTLNGFQTNTSKKTNSLNGHTNKSWNFFNIDERALKLKL